MRSFAGAVRLKAFPLHIVRHENEMGRVVHSVLEVLPLVCTET